MILDIILILITLIALVIATITDIKKREVPDFLSYSLLSIAIFSKTLQALIEKSLIPVIYAIIGFAIYFILALIMYYTKQWGGGDSKLLMSLGIIFSQYPISLLKYFSPNLNIPVLLSLLINILLAGSVYGIIYSLILAVKNKNKFNQELKKINKKHLKYFIIAAVLLFIISFFIKALEIKLLTFLISMILILTPYLLILIKTVEKSCMIKKIPVSKLTEGDWLTENIYNKKQKLIYSSKSPGITLEQIQQIKKLNIKKVTIKEGIPFVPSFLLAVIITLIYGNVIFFI